MRCHAMLCYVGVVMFAYMADFMAGVMPGQKMVASARVVIHVPAGW